MITKIYVKVGKNKAGRSYIGLFATYPCGTSQRTTALTFDRIVIADILGLPVGALSTLSPGEHPIAVKTV